MHDLPPPLMSILGLVRTPRFAVRPDCQRYIVAVADHGEMMWWEETAIGAAFVADIDDLDSAEGAT